MRASTQNAKGHLVKICAVEGCGEYPSFSNDCNMRAGIVGHWWCAAHWREVNAGGISVPVWQDPHRTTKPTHKNQGTLF